MRLFPPVPVVSRTLKDDIDLGKNLHSFFYKNLGGKIVPAGATVVINQYVVHRNPTVKNI